MPDPFFAIPAGQKGTKRLRTNGSKAASRPKKKQRISSAGAHNLSKRKKDEKAAPIAPEEISDEEISSDFGSDESGKGENRDEKEDSDEDEYVNETGADRRLRLAKQHLSNIRKEIDPSAFDAADLDKELISQRLRKDVAETTGRVHNFLAEKLNFSAPSSTNQIRLARDKVATGTAYHYPFVYLSFKDGSIEKWDLSKEEKPVRISSTQRGMKRQGRPHGHVGEVLCMALGGAKGKYLASGGRDNRIFVWDTETLRHVKVFRTHRGPVNCMAFRHDTSATTWHLYTGSGDRTIKVFSLDQLTYVETLYGHQDAVTDIDGFASEQCVSVGSRDKSVRVWKIVDETQLVFNDTTSKIPNVDEKVAHFPEGSIDCVSVIDEHHFLSAGDNGSIYLWTPSRRKPLFIQRLAHGLDSSPDNGTAEKQKPELPLYPPQPRWISCLKSLRYSDLFFSGSWDGNLMVWKLLPTLKSFELLHLIPLGVKGVVNEIDIAYENEKTLRIHVLLSKELRLGRWLSVEGGKNVLLALRYSTI